MGDETSVETFVMSLMRDIKHWNNDSGGAVEVDFTL